MPEGNGAFRPSTNRQWAWDSTSLSALKTCPQKYKYSIIDGWVPRETAADLAFGMSFHTAMEHYEKYHIAGQGHDEALTAVVSEALISSHPWPYEHKFKTRENLIRSIVWCIEHYRDDSARTVVLANGKPAVELSFSFDIGNGYVLCGHLDRIIDFNGEQFVVDYKTASSAPGNYYFERYNPDNQMSLYSIAARVVFGLPIRGVMIYAVQIAVTFTRPERGMTYRTPEQLEEWLADTQRWIALADAYAERNHWPRNDTACNMYSGADGRRGCPYKGVCSKDPSVRDVFLQTDFVKRTWDPTTPR